MLVTYILLCPDMWKVSFISLFYMKETFNENVCIHILSGTRRHATRPWIYTRWWVESPAHSLSILLLKYATPPQIAYLSGTSRCIRAKSIQIKCHMTNELWRAYACERGVKDEKIKRDSHWIRIYQAQERFDCVVVSPSRELKECCIPQRGNIKYAMCCSLVRRTWKKNNPLKPDHPVWSCYANISVQPYNIWRTSHSL